MTADQCSAAHKPSRRRVARRFRRCAAFCSFVTAIAWLSAADPASASERTGESDLIPATLQLAAIRATAEDVGSAYHIDPGGRGVNPRHGLALTYTPEGVSFESRRGSLVLRLVRFGRGDGEPVRQMPPKIDGAWVEYDRSANLREWFANSPQGVEQGWTIEERPVGSGPLILSLDTARPPDRVDDRTFTWSGLAYHGLTAVDAEGRVLPSHWAAEGALLHIQVDDDSAVYPVVIDPWVHEAKLVASDGADNDRFGASVALSGDTALVGTPFSDPGGNHNRGAVYVFTRTEEGWEESAKLVASDGAQSDNFGEAVALSGDTALMGARFADVGGNGNQGAAYVFTRTGEVWSEQAKLIAADGAVGDRFGSSVALSGDTSLVGAAGTNVDDNADQGAAYVFTHTGEVWSEQAKLVAADGAADDQFGSSVALSGDTALVGAPEADLSSNVDQGAAYVFTRTGEMWSEQTELVAADGAAGDQFGVAVALSADTALVGAWGADPGGNTDEGAAYVFTRTDEVWNEQGKLLSADENENIGDFFGISVALSGDTALVGATRAHELDDEGNVLYFGAVYVYTRTEEVWEEQVMLIAPDGPPVVEGGFGSSLTLAGDTALVGRDPGDGAPPGSAFVFVDRAPEFAIIEGTVQSLGACSEDPGSAADAEIVIQGQTETFTVIPDETSGSYLLALDPAEGPVDITASAPGHIPQTVTDVELAESETVTQDFGLALDAPCAVTEPTNLVAELVPDQIVTETLTLGNVDGAGDLDWSITTSVPGMVSGKPDAGLATAHDTVRAHLDVEVPTHFPTKETTDLVSVLGEPLPGLLPIQLTGGVVDCEDEPGIIFHDDGTIENGYSAGGSNNEVAYLDPYTPVPGASIDAVCLAFISLGPTSLDLEIVVFDDDGPGGGRPGTELGSVPVSIHGIPVVVPPLPPDLQPVWFSFDISSLGIVVDSGEVFIGARWTTSNPNVFIAADESPDNPPGFAGGYVIEPDGDIEPISDEQKGYRSLFVRAVQNPGGCLDPTTVPWLSVAPTSGTVPSSDVSELEVTVDATGLEQGEYPASLCVTTNDPLNPLIIVPVRLKVLGSALVSDPATLDFGDVEGGTTSPAETIVLSSVGALDASGLTFQIVGDDGFDADTADCDATLPVGAQCEIHVTFSPQAPGPASATLEVHSDDGAIATTQLGGNGVPATEAFSPLGLVVDTEPIVSDGNGIFEPSERVSVAPIWRNDGLFAQFLEGTASNFTGPEGPTYSLPTADADYGEVESGQMSSCQTTELCYEMDIGPAGVPRPATHWMATFDETLSDETTKTWALHIGESFTDVPPSNLFYRFIETLLHHGVTGGCTATEYCPAASNTRGQMAVFLLKAVAEEPDYAPPACTVGDERFADVPFDNTFCPWIEELAERGITSGCGGGNYCPDDTVTRSQMAIFLLKAFEGEGYVPPECSGEFSDVDCPSAFADWIEELAARGVTGGCGAEPPAYCPADPVTRAQMAAFVTRTFGLTLYGP